jgi:hypothetical protein
MKYMTKQFGSGDEQWSTGEILFNAMVWDSGTRMLGASKNLTAIMRKSEEEFDVVWDTVDLLILGVQFEVWSRYSGKPYPTLGENKVNEQDMDDLSRKWGDKTILENLYDGIERWRKYEN